MCSVLSGLEWRNFHEHPESLPKSSFLSPILNQVPCEKYTEEPGRLYYFLPPWLDKKAISFQGSVFILFRQTT